MPLIRAWRNDYKIWRWCRQHDLISDFDQARWFDTQSKDPTIKMYKIMVCAVDSASVAIREPITVGVCGFTSIDLHNRRAEFSLYIAPAYQHRDFGSQGLRSLLTHGFSNLGFHVIWGEVFEGNPALEKFEALGFKRDGIRRDFYFRDGKYIDAHLISIKDSEWK